LPRAASVIGASGSSLVGNRALLLASLKRGRPFADAEVLGAFALRRLELAGHLARAGVRVPHTLRISDASLNVGEVAVRALGATS
jgi:hypothetical protein